MTVSKFDNKNNKPSEGEISEMLGQILPLWEGFKTFLEKKYPIISEEWKFYGRDSGWGLFVKNQSRTILYLYPGQGFFKVLFVFGEKAFEAAVQSDLPKEFIMKITQAKRRTEGRSFLTFVKTEADLDLVKRLTEIKMKN